ncbi:unnamed protein product (macronuclear) [Paramecium tetraurelia]|uniref:Electron transfer flavoprotein subunit beta n=1 Tax=Paramecium tetraurelia TaxID=5888 RepID=A0BPP5_PARTE|nr:uncharacterized protein GSPATT00005262001 [Paramecium tetraurelia]CAK60512.1 unnamed protein product [Paramecium tetraurelia]|eukprot:XP_001427910.1 hypothetical protein (macronuclear) [Paramecium tetraurelia strain d4-2]
MKVLVAVKRVVDSGIKVRVKPEGIDLQGVKMTINPFCEIAVEEAVRLKEKKLIAEIVAVTIGPKQGAESLRHALALGADKAIHVTTEARIDQAVQPLDVANILAKLVERDNYNLVLMGKQSIDDDFNQTGQMLAGLLDWPQATFASNIQITDGVAQVIREIDGGLQTVKFKLPGVITCDLRLNQPRFASVPNIMKAKSKPLETIPLDKLGKLHNSIQITKTEAPAVRKGGAIVENVDVLLQKLRTEAKLF